MTVSTDSVADMPVVGDPRDFDHSSGNWLERLIFNHRLIVLLLCAAASVFLGYHATHLRVNASYEKMFPRSHPYIRNYVDNQSDLGTLGNTLRIAIENRNGDIYDPAYLEVVRKATDGIMVTHGVFRGFVRSLWLPAVRWTDIVEEGYIGGPVMPDDFDGSPAKIEQLRINVQRASIVGTLVSPDFKSSMIVVPLLDLDPDTGEALDYHELSRALENKIRALETDTVKIHIVGFAKLVGDLIDGLIQVMSFFAVAAVIAGMVIFFYTRCLRSTLLLVGVATLGVVWMLGLIQLLGYVLDPYSVLVPFLVFAIGCSHGAQKMNGIMQDIARGTHAYVAARYTFRRLFVAGLTALLTNVVGFAVLMVIDIPVIRELALVTSIGVSVLIVTKLVLIPVALSYIGVSRKSAQRRLEVETQRAQSGSHGGLQVLVHLTERRWAIAVLLISAVVALVSFSISRDLKVGDLDPGAPELWPDSRYNRDSAFITQNFGLSTDQFAVIVKGTGTDPALQVNNLLGIEQLSWTLQQVPGVQAVVSLADRVPYVNMGQFEGNPKWMTVHRSPNAAVAVNAIWSTEGLALVNTDYSVMPVIAYLTDHKAETLDRVLAATEAFAAQYNTPQLKFLPVAGSAGIEAVTNIVVRKAHHEILLLLYAAVIVLCFITFRSWRAVIVALIPLVITAIICEALMVRLGIGLKVATLPVHALGVGVGVDYALYLLSVQLAEQRRGASLREAYAAALDFTGRVVALIGVTMAAGVVTWAWSPIKFQADMGILLTFMFIWNMIGALILIPALSHFLLAQTSSHTRNAKAVACSESLVG